MWQKRLKLGTYFRIGVYVHWTLSFLVAYAAYEGFQGGLVGSAYFVLLLFGMLLCVTLHEYGHALTARRFGVETVDITLFPIGGVARLAKIPRVPWQEFLVATAGPAVNVVIASIILTVLYFVPLPDWPSGQTAIAVEDSVRVPSASGFLVVMLVINGSLVLFNMIPAFPMDGGRVLRSLLAMIVSYRNATRVAAAIGILCATGMLVAAIYFKHPVAGLIAVFIAYAGHSERRHVELLEPIRHLTVRSVMIHSPPRLSMDTPLGELPELLSRSPLTSIPIVGVDQIVTGMLEVDAVAKALRSGSDASTPIGMIANHDVETVSPDLSLEAVLTGSSAARYTMVTDIEGRLIGLLDLHTIAARGELAASRDGEIRSAETKN